jgi:hypothetical protein
MSNVAMRVLAGAVFLLLASTAAANAGPLVAFLAGITTQLGLTGIGGALFGLSGGTAIGAFAAGAQVVSFLGSPVGSLRPARLDREHPPRPGPAAE